MLVHLSISNFAIIRRLEIDFRPGLNILSGETGAGKSIIINAMNLILGGRASSDLIRTGCTEARVEALFAIPENPVVLHVLFALGVSFDGELVIKRTISKEGRNRITINGSLATLQMLSRLGPHLISISGQHEHQLLLKPENHLYLLDDFALLVDKRTDLGLVFADYQELNGDIIRLEREIKEAVEREELTRFQIREIEMASVNPREDEALAEEKRRLQHVEDLIEIVSESYHSIYERNDSALSLVSQCEKRLGKGAQMDPRLASLRDALSEIGLRLEEVGISLRELSKDTHADPGRLEEIADRLHLLNSLKRKYGPTLEDVLAIKDNLKASLEGLTEKTEHLEQLRGRRGDLEVEILRRAEELSRLRKEGARKLEEAVETELQQLHMAKTRFEVNFEDETRDGEKEHSSRIASIRADGFDEIAFMIAPNVGEELRPLSRIASGGELSRALLALKTILARTASVETIIFDEVDAGIGGATAEVVGEKLVSLAQYHQILCITHLPQIACKGVTHFRVRKEEIDGRTETLIAELNPEARVMEVARLLGGREITKRAVDHAVEMLC